MRGFWPISQEQDFSQRICAGTQHIEMFNIEYSENYCPNFPLNLKNPTFGHFGGKQVFP